MQDCVQCHRLGEPLLRRGAAHSLEFASRAGTKVLFLRRIGRRGTPRRRRGFHDLVRPAAAPTASRRARASTRDAGSCTANWRRVRASRRSASASAAARIDLFTTCPFAHPNAASDDEVCLLSVPPRATPRELEQQRQAIVAARATLHGRGVGLRRVGGTSLLTRSAAATVRFQSVREQRGPTSPPASASRGTATLRHGEGDGTALGRDDATAGFGRGRAAPRAERLTLLVLTMSSMDFKARRGTSSSSAASRTMEETRACVPAAPGHDALLTALPDDVLRPARRADARGHMGQAVCLERRAPQAMDFNTCGRGCIITEERKRSGLCTTGSQTSPGQALERIDKGRRCAVLRCLSRRSMRGVLACSSRMIDSFTTSLRRNARGQIIIGGEHLRHQSGREARLARGGALPQRGDDPRGRAESAGSAQVHRGAGLVGAEDAGAPPQLRGGLSAGGFATKLSEDIDSFTTSRARTRREKRKTGSGGRRGHTFWSGLHSAVPRSARRPVALWSGFGELVSLVGEGPVLVLLRQRWTETPREQQKHEASSPSRLSSRWRCLGAMTRWRSRKMRAEAAGLRSSTRLAPPPAPATWARASCSPQRSRGRTR